MIESQASMPKLILALALILAGPADAGDCGWALLRSSPTFAGLYDIYKECTAKVPADVETLCKDLGADRIIIIDSEPTASELEGMKADHRAGKLRMVVPPDDPNVYVCYNAKGLRHAGR
jgi:hypothetical protein